MRRTVVISGVASFTMAFVGTLLALALALPPMVEAQQSRLRAEALAIWAPNGADRIRLQGQGQAIAVLGEDGQTARVTMNSGGPAANPDPRNAGVNLYTQDGVAIGRLGTQLGPDGELWGGRLRLGDPDGTDRLDLTTGPGVRAAVTLRDATGTRRAQMATGGVEGTNPTAAGFNVYNPDDVQVGRLGFGEQGSHLILRDGNGTIRVRLAVTEDGDPGIWLYDAAGNVTWSAR